jgi:hypothetical protein
VADGFQQLINDGNRWRLERRLAGPMEDEPPARSREQAEDHRMLGQKVSLEDLGVVVIQLEHPGIVVPGIVRAPCLAHGTLDTVPLPPRWRSNVP